MYLLILTLARHLLGKKSWNVYNADNIAKVKHDEALAAASEAAEEQRMQEADAANRIRILRGLPVPPLAPSEPVNEDNAKKHERRRDQEHGRDRKKRRIAGEDETEREIRIARENAAAAPPKHSNVQKKPRSDMPLVDGKGNINLFPIDTPSIQKSAKNAEAEAEAAKKKREYEDQYTMRFSNAAGFKQDVGQQPWYSSIDPSAQDGDDGATATLAIDVWGNEDPRRKERYTRRLTANDPLSAMKRGVEELREVEKERNHWKEERDRDIQELIDSERPSRSNRKKRKSGDIDRFESEDEKARGRGRRRRRKGKRKQKSEDENVFYSDGENASRSSRKKKPKPEDEALDSLDDEFKSHALPLEYLSDHYHHHSHSHHHHHQEREETNASKERSSQKFHHRHRGRSRDRSRRQVSRHRRSHHHQHRKNSIEKGEEEEEEEGAEDEEEEQERRTRRISHDKGLPPRGAEGQMRKR